MPGISEAEWQALYARLEKPLYNVAYRYVWRSREAKKEAQDIVHDAFLELWARREKMIRDTADRYLWVAVLNLSRKRRRWSRAKRFLTGDEDLHLLASTDSPEMDATRTQAHSLLHAAIDQLPEKLRTVLLLVEFSDMSYETLSAMLSIPAGTVASRRHLAVKQLREALE